MRLALFMSVIFSLAIVLAGPVQPTPPESHVQNVVAEVAADIDQSVSEVVVEVAGPDAYDAVESLVLSGGASISYSSRATGIMSVSMDGAREGLVDEISAVQGVVSVSPERKARLLFDPDDPWTSYQWALDEVEAYDAWDIDLGSHDVIVAVLDTGIDWNHADISPNIWSNGDGYHGYNFIDDNWFPMDDNVNGYDENGDWVANMYTYHGTHVAGVVGAATDNGIGMAGLAQVRLMAVKVMNDSGEGTDSTVASGIRWATDNGAHVIVMSLGVEGISLPLQNAVNYAASRGVVLVAAAGNDGTSVLSYPAAFLNVIAVGAIDDTERRASFSNFGTELDVVAPGVNIYSTQGGGSYQYLSGTSAAAPHVAAVAALMLTVNPALTPEDVGQIINETANDLSIPGWDTGTGWGVVSAFGAIEAVADPTVTITDFPEYVEPNGTYSITWLVSGGDPGTITDTYLQWGFASGDVDGTSGSFSGTTWAEFTVEGLPSLPGNGTIYLTAFAVVDGTTYSSEELEIPVMEAPDDNLFMQFIRDVQDFIFDELGVLNFLLIMCVLVAVPVIAVVARSRSRRLAAARARAEAVRLAQARSTLEGYQQVQGGPRLPPPPPPPPRFEAYVDIVGSNVVPQVVKVVEGTKVVWVNRTWAPPPGSSVKSGTVDASGEHHDGLFSSGLLIAPGDYWSCTFHRAGEYPYYLTNVWRSGTVIVERYRDSPQSSSPDA
ncbi:MAG: S8 family serine peptidase [Candidatus Thermoplasmatota archaeon]